MSSMDPRAFALLALLLATRVAAADHAHHEHSHGPSSGEAVVEVHAHDAYAAVLGGHHHGPRGVSMTFGAVAARYDTRLYTGHYEGVTAGAAMSLGRFGVAAGVSAYRIDRNGASDRGLGDTMVHVHGTLVERRAWQAGLGVMASAPTGSTRDGLGMGHVMAMADAWARWRHGRVALSGSVGHGRSLGGAGAHAEHGATWPLVAPMSASEIFHAADAVIAVHPRVALGVATAGAVPIGAGTTRWIGSAHARWALGATLTTLELQRGLVGDPFGTRVLATTTFRLE